MRCCSNYKYLYSVESQEISMGQPNATHLCSFEVFLGRNEQRTLGVKVKKMALFHPCIKRTTRLSLHLVSNFCI